MGDRVPLTPDFIDHAWVPLAAATLADGFVHVERPDGRRFAAYSLWLAENAAGYGLEPVVRESMVEPGELPDPAAAVVAVHVDPGGALVIGWHDGRTSAVHPGWLRHVADWAPAGILAADADGLDRVDAARAADRRRAQRAAAASWRPTPTS